ncbi:two-component system sensor histidine kinase TctE [Variovorax sp. SG517]|uniref:sensor histidine kinase n=1 Tax=Variovorax sp. SG517 TaxID=2587117 RepID=UPI00159D7139|nr:ATP-binding protein [Variovorax sp. SG517]NVM87065.1 two-component system sensor histidine kinase TctE [Variovorax sp. SG517]
MTPPLRSPRPTSLRRFLLLWLLGGLWLLTACIVLVHLVAALVALAREQDARLAAKLGQIDTVGGEMQGAQGPLPPVPLFYRLGSVDGSRIAGDPQLEAFPWISTLPESGEPRFYVSQRGNVSVRAVAALRKDAGDPGRKVVVQFAEPMHVRFDVWHELPLGLLGWIGTAAVGMSLVVISGVVLTSRWLERARQALDAPQLDMELYDGPSELRPAMARMHELHLRQREWVEEQRRFLADASHQLRTPMSVLRTQLQSAIAGDVPATEVLPQMLHTVDRATDMANQLLSLSKLEQIKRAGRLQTVLLHAVALDAVMELAPLIAAKRLDFALEGDDTLGATGDPLMLGELLRNLLANAIHHTPDGGRLGILVRAYAATVELVVWDGGPGVDDALRPRLFQAFSATKGGVGLGLSICRQIAEAMGASMEIHNRVDGGRVIGVDAVVRWSQGP